MQRRTRPKQVVPLPKVESSSGRQQERNTSEVTEKKQEQSRLWYLVYIAMLVATPMIVNHAALTKEQRVLMPKPGELIQIDQDQRLFIKCMGDGSPTVILESPVGATTDAWQTVQESLAKVTKVCSYDRAGLGFSDRPFINVTSPKDKPIKRGQPYTAERMVDDFNRLFVTYSSLKPPFILVGAEMGALLARFSIQLFENLFAGLVLVDPLVEGVFQLEQGLFERHWFDERLPLWQQRQILAATGMNRLGLITGWAKLPVGSEKLNEEQAARQKHLLCKPAHWQAAIEELVLVNETISQLRLAWRIKSFPKTMPVSILTADVHDNRLGAGVNRVWRTSQDHLLKTVHQNCFHRRLAGASGRRILTEHPGAVHDMIVKMVNEARLGPKKTVEEKPAPEKETASTVNLGRKAAR